MGLIEKSIRKKTNQKLTEPMVTSTAMSASEALTAITDMCAKYNSDRLERHEQDETERSRLSKWAAPKMAPKDKALSVLRQDKHLLIGYALTPEQIQVRTDKTTMVGQFWLARVRFLSPKADAAPGTIDIELQLIRWITDSDGKVVSYQKFAELAEAIRALL